MQGHQSQSYGTQHIPAGISPVGREDPGPELRTEGEEDLHTLVTVTTGPVGYENTGLELETEGVFQSRAHYTPPQPNNSNHWMSSQGCPYSSKTQEGAWPAFVKIQMATDSLMTVTIGHRHRVLGTRQMTGRNTHSYPIPNL